ncbi:MAG: lipopolysaccharide heptosyltransferase II [Dehalococcoidia bacterium]|nr:lipopolysaccharide heptosyltransferase II [Dehalococcoidia bacterium]
MSRAREWVRREIVETGIDLLGAPIWVWATLRKRRPARPVVLPPRRSLVIRLDLLGDVALTLPAVQSLRDAYPAARIAMMVRPSAAPLVKHAPAVDEIIPYDIDRLRPSREPLSPSGWRDLWAMVDRLRASEFDLAVGMFGVWASFFAFASDAPIRVGYRHEGFPGLYTLPVAGKRYLIRAHESAYCLRLARAAGGAPPTDTPTLRVDAATVEAARTLLAAAGHDPRAPLVVAHPGATQGAAKRWTPTGWAQFIDAMHAHGAQVALVGAADEQAIAESIVAQTTAQPLRLTGATSLPMLLGVLSVASVVVSGDSGPLHFAGALGRPVVGVYGPSDPLISGPLRRGAPVVRLSIPCSPCYDGTYRAECPLRHHRCMRELSSAQVVAATLDLLRRA